MNDESDSFQVRTKILAAIDATDDKMHRNLLLLMFGVLEQNERGMKRIEEKIDTVLRDEQALRRIVLNGSMESHDDDHHWIREQRELDCPAVCNWAQKKMAEELESEKVSKGRFRMILDKMAEHAVTIMITAIAMYFGVVK